MTDGDKQQRERFIKKAKELECDEDEGNFRDILKRVVKPKDGKGKRSKKA